MKKKTTPRTMRTKTDRQEFSILRRQIESLGFKEIPPDRKIKEGWIHPNVKRMEEIYDAMSFELKIGDYTMVIVTPFNMVIKERDGKWVNGSFSHLGGGFWIHINDKEILDPEEQALFTRKRFYPKNSERRKVFRKRFLMEAKAVVWGLRNRPKKTSKNGRMVLFDPSASRYLSSAKKFVEVFDRLESKVYEPIWVTENSARYPWFEYFKKGMPKELNTFFNSLNKVRKRYHKNRNVAYTENEVKNPWYRFDASKNFATTK